MTPGELWFVRSKNDDDPEVELVEIVYLNGNVVGFGEAYYDLRLLDFVGRDYEREEQREQERFLEQMRVHDDMQFKEAPLVYVGARIYDDSKVDENPEEKPIMVYPREEPKGNEEQDIPSHTKLSWWTRLKIWWITHAP